VNAASGFSIVKYTGNNSTGTVGHGLSSAPEIVIIKRINSVDNWQVSVSNITGTTAERVYLNLTQGTSIDPGRETAKPSATVLNVGGYDCFNEDYIAYCFHSVSGYQKIGSYTGTGAAGNKQTIGFQPRFILLKPYDQSSTNWIILDSIRDGNTSNRNWLKANTSEAEATTAPQGLNFLSDGFDFEGFYHNDLNWNFIYLAIA